MARTGTLRFDLDLRESLNTRLNPQAVILQEDRNLVMAPPGILDLDADYDLGAAFTAIASHRPLPLGRYLVLRGQEGGVGWVYRAVVHDLANNPTCRPGDVRRSLTAILGDAARRGIGSLAAEPLGFLHHEGLDLGGLVEAFDRAILETSAELAGSVRLTLLLDRFDQLAPVAFEGSAAGQPVLSDGQR